MKENSNQLVLVTGGTGFLGSHCLLKLLELGYNVRTTVRSIDRKEEVLAMLNFGGMEKTERLSFYAADLRKDEGWQNAISGCDYVLHVASPFPAKMPRDENELIVPAREGSLRVLKIAGQEKVKRVVLTSSFAAIGYGHEKTDQVFTEADWTDPGNPNVSAYVKYKSIEGYVKNSNTLQSCSHLLFIIHFTNNGPGYYRTVTDGCKWIEGIRNIYTQRTSSHTIRS